MPRFIRSKTILTTALLVGSLAASACSGGGRPDAAGDQAESGTVNLPLTTTANSHTYRLSGVYLSISGNTNTTLTTTDSPEETSLSVTLPTGNYNANLYYWTLEQQQPDGQFVGVPATLLSNQYQGFGISNGSTTTISYRFQTDGVIVTVGAGELRVKVAVDEVPPPCTPFGTDCGEGTWCAPAGLTGAILACIPAGTVAVGDPCSAPSDCVSTSSCIDLGGGPVCAELCSSGRFGQACDSGGTCQGAAPDYGVCR
jgi:hypothetical protein